MRKTDLEKHIATLYKKWDSWVRVKDLIEAGLIGTYGQFHNMQKNGTSPPSVKIGGRILIRKEDVINWIRDNCN
jgi:hypothetical protein